MLIVFRAFSTVENGKTRVPGRCWRALRPLHKKTFWNAAKIC